MKREYIVRIIVVIVAIVCVIAFFYLKSMKAGGVASVEGYVKTVDAQSSTILICESKEDATSAESMGDYSIVVQEDTQFKEGVSLDTLAPGDCIIVEYTGDVLEVYPAVIEGATYITIR